MGPRLARSIRGRAGGLTPSRRGRRDETDLDDTAGAPVTWMVIIAVAWSLTGTVMARLIRQGIRPADRRAEDEVWPS